MKTIPPEIVDAIIALVSAIIGWFSKKFTTKKQKDGVR